MYKVFWDESENTYRFGTNQEVAYNAIVNGKNGCPPKIHPPSNYNDGTHGLHPITIVGVSAFDSCGYDSITTSIFIPKEIRVIKKKGFHQMHKVTSFVLEPGSKLETIEYKGLDGIGLSTKVRTVLVLPKSLRSVTNEGLHLNTLFSIIIYCGDTVISNSCSFGDSSSLSLQTTESYSGTSLFGVSPVKNNNAISVHCSIMETEGCFTYVRESHKTNAILIFFLVFS